MIRQTTDPALVEAFAERLLGMMNDASLALMTSIGHRTGLFDTLGGAEPMTSAELAAAAGLEERYVREWLGSMTTGGFVTYDAESGRYALPAEHAACLTRAAGADNLASTAQWIAVLGSVEDRVVECFRDGGGVSYDHYARFHEVMASESEQTVVGFLCDAILPLDPDLIGRLREGASVLDVGCGSGRALNRMAREFPVSRFVGYDLSEEGIARARREAAEQGLDNVRFEVRDVTELGDVEAFDLVTAFDAIHDQIQPDRVLAGIRRALKPGGRFLMQDIRASSHVQHNVEHPLGPFLYTISSMHCMTVSLANGGAGLGTCWGEERAVEMLDEAGFAEVDVRTLPHDILNNYYLTGRE